MGTTEKSIPKRQSIKQAIAEGAKSMSRKVKARNREAIPPQAERGNPLPNRKTRRQQAMVKARATWKQANAGWQAMNRQTEHNKDRIRANKKQRRQERLAKKEAKNSEVS